MLETRAMAAALNLVTLEVAPFDSACQKLDYMTCSVQHCQQKFDDIICHILYEYTSLPSECRPQNEILVFAQTCFMGRQLWLLVILLIFCLASVKNLSRYI